jgi:broad specificity phosphatase PhoE
MAGAQRFIDERVIYLARHGQTAYNALGLILGHRDPPLSELGLEQARQLAANASHLGVRSLFTSPLLRARRTAEIVGATVGVAPTVLGELVESSRGHWEGRDVASLARDEPELHRAFLAACGDFQFPGGESLRSQRDRTRTALAVIAGAALPALAVTHAGTIRAAMTLFELPVPPEADLPTGRVVLRVVCGADGPVSAHVCR